ncbi:hypothetical protein A2957_02760 [Candidatus Roizmanbacteria bacterium RIFCSPLOWO2_01_FULL_38_11]|uniref:Ig-like domain-containing protein n=1 Tax=Candidatus Roizmanbacteria bacterium RIFCSPLOWO2_01_FULL_38_11 TaxID=1802060 RepID=A0A1F7IKT6_9BACT|nr:MAG: hypothetical protein A2957_02760 [Candidatus Roizmanbacteria bacterium RIFCSPLOWO2_01_FULL_38_11]
MFKKTIFSAIALALLLWVSTSFALAVEIPNFPSCLNPQGDLKASYSSGTHGVVGRTQSYSGSDKVYQLSDATLTQCFCSSNGEGIQTNWWKTSGLTNDEVEILKRSGWFYVPNGALWGLDSEPYLAKNIEYSCLAIGGSVLGTSDSDLKGKVLGLASTGSKEKIYDFWLAGLLLLTYGVWLKRYQLKKKSL